ncbi:MAG: hypothetical protein KatS3mg008_0476 [Acidimicrobiales bacterium]|nr:MAG: hypothetical protein KatS3mg008_0476 [Acidimicrobiales bacterium]
MAVVLTHDAPRSLRRCVASIAGQSLRPDWTLVVDNASSTPVDPDELPGPVRVLRLGTNEGPAGGWAEGLRRVLAEGPDLLWLMDDDCEPRPDALEQLKRALDEGGPETGVAYPLWHEPPGGPGVFRPAWCGVLLRRVVVERAGLPMRELVWWAEDTEYLQWRVRNTGFGELLVPNAHVDHHRGGERDGRALWKLYYETRNTVYFRLWIQRRPYRRFRRMARSLTKLAWRAIRSGADARAATALWFRGLVDGLTGRLGVRVPLGQSPLGSSERHQ